MAFKCGIVGLPNVGKSTLFNALTKASARTANFAFCTVEPNTSIVSVPDKRLNLLTKIVKPQLVSPAIIKFVDIAGLIKGSSKGCGMGNQFLTHIRDTEVIVHVVRCFKNNKVPHITEIINPVEDINLVNTELALSDLDICKRALYCFVKKDKNNDRKARTKIEILERCIQTLENNCMLRILNLNKEEKETINYLNLLTLKPIMYVANINKGDLKNNSYLSQIYSLAKTENAIVVPICAIFETITANLDIKNNRFVQELNPKESGLDHIISAGYSLLNMLTYFTSSTKEVRACSILANTNIQQAARKIHTDFEKGFIRAQVISYEDFITYNGEHGAKEAGRIQIRGREYIVKDGDVIKFLYRI